VLQKGDILVGRYEVGSLLGHGGMSSVFSARDRTLGREVAIKVLAAELAEEDTFVARFDREARAAASLSHRNVVAVFDTGVEDGVRFIVMERVSGRTVAALLREGPLPIAQAVEIGARVAQALGAAHVRGVVHRDVKPGNVMVGPGGQVKVLDFGIARALAATSLTRASTVIGTAGYLSPEQAEGRPVDARSDVYGLGCVLYEMLTGRPPFVADSAAALVHQHVNRPPQPPSRWRPEVSGALDEIVLRCLAKDPKDRYPATEEVSESLMVAPLTAAEEAPPPREATTRVLPSASAAGPTAVRTPPRARRGRRWVAVPAAATLLGALALILALGHGSAGRAPASTGRLASTKPGPSRASGPAARRRADPAGVAKATTGAKASSPTGSAPSASAPPDPSAALASLAALTLADEQQGLLDERAARAISRRSDALVRALSSGDAGALQQQLAAFGSRVDALAASGDVSTVAAAEALKSAAAGVMNAFTAASGASPSGVPPAGAAREAPTAGGEHGKRHPQNGAGEESQD
jgi:serine/threonine-protein kinase